MSVTGAISNVKTNVCWVGWKNMELNELRLAFSPESQRGIVRSFTQDGGMRDGFRGGI